MSDFTAQTETFLQDSTGFLSRSLTEAVIKQMGGEDVFIKHHANMIKHGMDSGFNGFISYHETVGFFNENSEDIKAYFEEVADCLGVASFMDVLFDNTNMKANLDLTSGEIAEAFFADKKDAGESTEQRVQLCNWVSWCVAGDAAGAYADFLYTLEQDEDDE